MINIKKILVVVIVLEVFFQNIVTYAQNYMGIENNLGQVTISGSIESANEIISLRVYDNNNSIVAIDSGKTDDLGAYSFEIKMSENASAGQYKSIVVSQSGEISEDEFYFDNSELEEYNIYVSHDGDNNNEGTAQAPLKSITAARDKIRVLKKENNYSYTVYVESGEYYIEEPIIFEAKDGGSDAYPITYKADGNVILKGSYKIDADMFRISDNEQIQNSARNLIYEADISGIIPEIDEYVSYGAIGTGTSYYELIDKGNVKTLARYPQEGFIYTSNINTDKNLFDIDVDDMENVWFKGYWGNYWSMESIEGSINSGVATLSSAPVYSLKNNRPYYIFNNIKLLDSPGEWYIDTKAKKLYYYPEENLDGIELSIMKQYMIDINGASNIVFDGINLENTRNIGYFVHGSAENVTIKNAEIKNIGNTAVQINSGYNVLVKDCNITSIGGRGIQDNGGNRYTLTSSGNIIEGCDISYFGRIYRSYAAGINVIGTGTTIRRNIIHDAPHFGISFDGNNNIITNNEIYNCCQYTRDVGAVYGGRDWLGFGNEISYNYIHDINTKIPGTDSKVNDVHAIYLDDMQSGTSVHNNTIIRSSRAIFVAGGKYNEIYSNIITDCDFGLLADSRGVEGNSQYAQTIDNGALMNNYNSVVKNEKFDRSVWEKTFPYFNALCESVENNLGGIPEGNIINSNIFSGNTENTDYMKYTPEFNDALYDNYFSEESDIGFADYENNDLKITGDIPSYVEDCRNNNNNARRTVCNAEVFNNQDVIIRNRTDSVINADVYTAIMNGNKLVKCRLYKIDVQGNSHSFLKTDALMMGDDEYARVFVWTGMNPLAEQ